MNALAQAFQDVVSRRGEMGVDARVFEVAAQRAAERHGVAIERLHFDDLHLALGCVAGNDAAWREFDRCYRRMLTATARRICGSEDGAKDLVHELFAQLFQRSGKDVGKMARYEGVAPLSTWLKVIVRRMTFDRGRSLQRRRRREREHSVEPRVTQQAGPGASVGERQAGSLTHELFAAALQSLTASDVLILTLVYRDGRTLRQAGEILGVDASTISRRAKAAREHMYQALLAEGRARYDLDAEAVAALVRQGAWAAAFEGEDP